MKKYEVLFILDPREDAEGLKGYIKDLFKEFGGEVVEEKEMGLKRLAYPIQKRDKGFYYLLNAKLETTKHDQIKRELNLKEPIMRYMFIALEK